MQSQKENLPTLGALILAGGKSERFGAPKVLQSFRGELFLVRIVNALVEAGSKKIFLVLGPQAQQHCARLPQFNSVTVVCNENYHYGQFSSVQAGVRASGEDPVSGILLCLIDQPQIRPETFSTLVQAARQNPQHILIPSYQNRNGHPIYLPRWLFPTILAAPITANLRQILSCHVEAMIKVPVADAGILADIDTPADLDRLEKIDSHRATE